MSVEDFKVIDFASIDKNGNTVLTISDHLEWDDKNWHLLILQKKINAYLSTIESGEFYDVYPDAKGRNIVINLVAEHEPNVNAKSFLIRVKESLKSAGYYFEFKVLKRE